MAGRTDASDRQSQLNFSVVFLATRFGFKESRYQSKHVASSKADRGFRCDNGLCLISAVRISKRDVIDGQIRSGCDVGF